MGKVITSNGGGGGGKGSFSITDRAINVNAAGRTTLATNSQSYVAFAGAGAVDDAGTSFIIPDDYKDGLAFAISWIMDGTGTDQVRFNLNILQQIDLGLEDSGTPTESLEILDDAQDTAAWKYQKTSKVVSGQTWTIGESCSLEIERDPGHANDVSADTAYLKHLIIIYNKK